jgi:phage FluMu gp28-like protein
MSPNPPPVLLPFQQRWLQDTSRVKVFEKSRRIGASWATAAHAVLEAGSGKQDVWYVSYNEESGKEFVRDCMKWCKWLNVAALDMGVVLMPSDDEGNLIGARAFQIVFPSGMRITALTSSPRNLRGRQGLVIIDEAAFHDNLSEVLKASFALLMWGGEVWIMSTHNGIDNAFATLCEDIQDGKRPYSLHRVTIEDALSEGLYRRICAVLGQPWSLEQERKWLADLEREYGDGVREELYCEPAKGGQSYLGRPLIESCMRPRPVLRIDRGDHWIERPQAERTEEILAWCEAEVGPLLRALPRDLPHCFGWDFGRYADRSVLAPCTLGQDLVRRVPFLIEMLGLPHADQWTVMEYVGDRLPSFFGAALDAGGNGSWIAEQAFVTYGDIVVQVDLTLKWYAENMPPFREAHERGVIEYPRDLDVRNDLMQIRRIDGVPRLPKDKNASEGGKTRRHGDAAIALCLAYAASREAEAESARWRALGAPFDVGSGPQDAMGG